MKFALLVNWGLSVSNSAIAPPFSLANTAYTLTAPCAQFAVTSTLDTSTYPNCIIEVNGNAGAFTFTTATVSSVNVSLCYGGCSTGVGIAYQFAVVTGLRP